MIVVPFLTTREGAKQVARLHAIECRLTTNAALYRDPAGVLHAVVVFL